ncbi:unnamed protein product [Chironomus riparius]|uniref:Peroxidase n=1 Tax=Chironomus riparius TaxID=315576 RepID=A0A9N9RNG0_9DIPT|nr:unnamed protein product [Chironomus riparius]
MNEMNKRLYPVLIALLTITVLNNNNNVKAIGCPEKCTCQQSIVKCIRQQLKSIPEVPAQTTTILDLRFNHLKEVPSNAFKDMKQLHSIFLNENQITTIQSEAFSNLPALRYLYLHQNHIRNVAADAFVNLVRLERLHLYGNKIQQLPFGVFDNMNSLKMLRLDSNLLECDCSMMWLVKHLQQARNHLNASASCKSPKVMEGKNLLEMNEDELHCKKPEILQDPNDVEVVFGSNAVFKCSADGDPLPDIKWMLNSNEINSENDTRVRISPDGTLQIDRIDERDQGIYTCMAKNSIGESISREARMTIRTSSNTNEESVDEASRPQFVQVPAGHVYSNDEADFIVMHCIASGIPQPHISWSFNNQPLHENEHVHIYDNGTLVISHPAEEHEGNYKCEATNELGTISTVANYKINVPTIITSPEDKREKTGTNVVLFCNADSKPEPNIFWSKDDHPLKFSSRIYLSTDNKTLNIDHIKESDAGHYVCVAENSLGSDEASANVEVVNPYGPPVLVYEPYDIEAFPGTTIELPCGAEGDPVPPSKWKKDGRTLTPSLKYSFSSAGSLFIANVNDFDSGRYECTVTNDFGRVTASCFVTVRRKEELALGDKFVRVALSEARNEVDAAINQTVASLFKDTAAPKQQSDLFKLVRFPTGPARELARASEIYERTLVNIRRHVNAGKNLTANATDIFNYDDLLSSEYLDLLAQLSDCTAHRVTPNCTDICYHNKYRTIDGTCNNFENSLWGTSLSAFRRLLPARYENGLNAPVGSTNAMYNGFKLPSARLISTTLISTDVVEQDMEITHMVMQWGQFLDHDLDHSLPSVSLESWDGVDCKKTCDFAPPCFPMEVPPNDPRVTNRRCIDFVRSSAACGSGMTSVFFGKLQPREQINQLTAFIDASQVYGHSQEFSRDLRNISLEGEDNGYLREGVHFPNQKSMLPFASPTDGIDCRRSLEESSVNCFTAGDVRVNEQTGLLSMHTIWMREHNRIVKYFNEINPHWTGEQTYQEARKIVGAMMQHITMQWLGHVIGSDGKTLLGEYQGYDSNINPSISNEFATAAFRFGHSLINPVLHRLDYNFEPIEQGHLPLRNAFFAPWRLVYEGGVDPIMRGLFTMPAKIKKPEQSLNSDLTEHLFTVAHAVSLDLAAMNIQRGRDHALHSYMDYRKLCNLTTSTTFEELTDITDEHVREKLKKLYGHPDSIDLWVGGILEDVMPGARVGPLFRCIIADQFKRLRNGDRFWYENPSVFKPEQLAQIKQTSLARVLCDNGDNITRITRDIFTLPSHQGGYVNCKDIPMISLRVWTDCSDCSHRAAYNLDITQLPRRNRFRRDLKMVDNKNDKNFELNSIEYNNIHHHDDEDVHFVSIDNDYFDMNEERIEGLENLIESFQKTLKKMRREIRGLKQTNNELIQNLNMTQQQHDQPHRKKYHDDDDEDFISNSNNKDNRNNNNLKSLKHHLQCVDKKGINRLNNEIWMEDDCTSCLCQHHQITCTIEKCPDITLKCENGLIFGKRIGKCCPACIEQKNEQISIDETTIMSNVTNSR